MSTLISGQALLKNSSYVRAREGFSRERAFSAYPSEYRKGHPRDEAERKTILQALTHVPASAHILDMPCGTGRLTRLLLNQCERVTGADASPGMADLAEQNHSSASAPTNSLRVEFDVADIMALPYKKNHFDAVICNRLFHHFSESECRVQALKELNRVCQGPVIVSFFNSFSASAMFKKARNWILNKNPADRLPISISLFNREMELAGLNIIQTYAVRWGRSPHWYVVAHDKESGS